MSCYLHLCGIDVSLVYVHFILSYWSAHSYVAACNMLQRCCWPIVHVESWSPLGCRAPCTAPRPAPWWWRSCQCSSLLNWGTLHTSHSTPAWPGLMCHEWNIQCRLVFISNLTYYIAFSYLLVSGGVCLSCNSKQRLTIHYCTLNCSKL